MDLEHIKKGMYVIINKPSSSYDGYEGKVESIYSDFGQVNIRLFIEETSEIITGFTEKDLVS